MSNVALPTQRDLRSRLGNSQRHQKGRVNWLDSARGIGIILVVVGHSLGGLIASGSADGKPALIFGFDAIYSFHMPLFFFLSGIFIQERLTAPYRRFVWQSFRRLMYPYCVWGLIQVSFILAAGRLVTHPLDLHPMLFISILWAPPSQFWFLYALFLMQLLTVLYNRFSNLKAMTLTAAAVQLIPIFYTMTTLLDMAARYWIFYALAIQVADYVQDSSMAVAVKWRFLPGLIILWIVAAVVGVWGGGYLTLWNLPAALLGTFIILKISTLHVFSSSHILQFLGRRSLPIFCMHVLVVAGTRIAFNLVLHIFDPYIILFVASISGLALPCVIYAVAKTAGMTRTLAME